MKKVLIRTLLLCTICMATYYLVGANLLFGIVVGFSTCLLTFSTIGAFLHKKAVQKLDENYMNSTEYYE